MVPFRCFTLLYYAMTCKYSILLNMYWMIFRCILKCVFYHDLWQNVVSKSWICPLCFPSGNPQPRRRPIDFEAEVDGLKSAQMGYVIVFQEGFDCFYPGRNVPTGWYVRRSGCCWHCCGGYSHPVGVEAELWYVILLQLALMIWYCMMFLQPCFGQW